MSKSCKCCGKSGLNWNFNILYKKWELLEADDRKHKCVFAKPSANKINIKNDPKINAALKKFQKQLDRDNKRVYYLRPPKNFVK